GGTPSGAGRFFSDNPPHRRRRRAIRVGSRGSEGRPDRDDRRGDAARPPPRAPAPVVHAHMQTPLIKPLIPLTTPSVGLSIYRMLQVYNFDNAPIAGFSKKSPQVLPGLPVR